MLRQLAEYFQVVHCSLSIAYCPLLIAHCSLPIAHCPLPIAHCPLLIAHCSLPIAHCPLPTVPERQSKDCSLPIATIPERQSKDCPYHKSEYVAGCSKYRSICDTVLLYLSRLLISFHSGDSPKALQFACWASALA